MQCRADDLFPNHGRFDSRLRLAILSHPYLLLLYQAQKFLHFNSIFPLIDLASNYGKLSFAMEVSHVLKEDLPQISDMSARFTIADPRINFELLGSDKLVEYFRTIALHNYEKALLNPTGAYPPSLVLKAYNSRVPDVIEASACIQCCCPDPYWQVPWKDEPGRSFVAPDCVDLDMYKEVENALQTDRKTYMKDRAHYCAFSKVPDLRKAHTDRSSKTSNSLTSASSVRNRQESTQPSTCSLTSAQSIRIWTNMRTLRAYTVKFSNTRTGNT